MSVEVKTPTRTQFEHSEFQCGEKSSNFEEVGTQKSVKFNEKSDSFHRFESSAKFQYRKRKPSYRNEHSQQIGGFRRKRAKSMPAAESNIVLPTKFLLGGNINDPLNLNSLNNEEVNKLLNQTPQSSPIVTPPTFQSFSVPVPFNITDPLNLESGDDSISKKKKRNKHHHKRKSDDSHNSSANTHPSKETERRKSVLEALKIEVDDDELPPPSSTISSSDQKPLEIHFSSKPVVDKIVSPVIPQISPSSRAKKRKRAMSMSDARPEKSHIARSILRTSLSPPRNSALHIDLEKTTSPIKRFKKQGSQKHVLPKYQKNPKFSHGNYNRYYGYRNPDAEHDQRLICFKKDWFEGKDVLDIGCNVGHITLAIGKDFQPRKIVGLDIDKKLIKAARKNVRYYMSDQSNQTEKFPVSSSLNFGPIEAPPVCDQNRRNFPKNVMFIQGNYVLEDDELLELQKEEYDVILALSLTKWIHLNSGDVGLKRFFKRIYRHLRPGGKLVLEPQPWSSYKKKKNLTEDIHKHFQSIQLKPAQFSDYLLREVGFSTCEVVDVPLHKAKGFRRPIQLYTKADTAVCSPKEESASCSPNAVTMETTANVAKDQSEKVDSTADKKTEENQGTKDVNV
ncbi:hypothetical protein FSP39_020775 [Pinctada imbricata]|uniref:RNA methyltransferase n=1 Tax=Pinctada imbricata TaxID=66713 RepID=A0AA89C455_PINIB|nr:hypothetical protein FSP39_020775 [Pinctada imbricata]